MQETIETKKIFQQIRKLEGMLRDKFEITLTLWKWVEDLTETWYYLGETYKIASF